jgi:hypothetical protein
MCVFVLHGILWAEHAYRGPVIAGMLYAFVEEVQRSRN